MKKSNVSSVALRLSLPSLMFCIFCFQDVQAKPGKAPKKPQSSQTVKQPPKTTDAVRNQVQRPFEEAFVKAFFFNAASAPNGEKTPQGKLSAWGKGIREFGLPRIRGGA